ncbi:DNA glycosylase AlkZ-like family protein [Streptomyces nojiriensis]
MIISERELNRATLGRQLLLEREPLSVPEGLRRVVALQAQHPASPYVALWNRLAGFTAAELDAAFSGRSAVKATLMRITLHAVHAEDYPAFRAAMRPTLYASRLGGRFAAAGLTPADADALLPDLLAFAREPRTSARMRAWTEERVGAERKDAAWWGLKGYAPLHHAPTGAPWSFGDRPSFVAADPSGASPRTFPRVGPWTRTRCAPWSCATWRGSGPPPSRTWPSSPWCSVRPSARRSAPWPAPSRSSGGRTA